MCGFGHLSGAFFPPAAGKEPICGQSPITPKFHNYTFGVAQNAEPNSRPWTVFLCLKGKSQNFKLDWRSEQNEQIIDSDIS